MSIDRGMDKDVVCMHNGILLSHQKGQSNAICSNTDGPRDCHTEWSKSDRGGEVSYGIPFIWNLKRNDLQITLLTKQKETHRLREQTYGCWREGIVRDLEMELYTLLYLKWITNKGIQYSTWNSVQCYLATWVGGVFGEEWIYVYVWLSCSAVHLKLSQPLLSDYTQYKNKQTNREINIYI